MKALIFNSGIGKRMGDLTKTKPKCMAEIGSGYTIVSWQLRLLQDAGIRDVVITTGPFAELLQTYICSLGYDLNIEFVHNEQYEITNYIFSMYCAREYLKDELVLLHGDLVLEPSVVSDLIKSPKSVVAIDSELPLPKKDFKAKLKSGRVTAIGVDLFGEDCRACQPAYKLRIADLQIWLDEISRFCEHGRKDVYAENALNERTKELELYPLELNLRLCNEIDSKKDLEKVSERFTKILGKARKMR